MIYVYRIAHLLWRLRIPLMPWLLKIVNRVVFAVVLPPSTKVGPGVLFSYQGLGTIVHKNAVIGAGATIGAGVTIGGRSGRDGVPVIGEHAMVGTGAKVLGPIRVGRHASIGANAVVLHDVPDFAVVAGVPAKVIRIARPDELVDYRQFSEARRDQP